MNFRKSGGFTLIELLVVISIISLLSSVILASIKDARLKARQKAFRTEITQLMNALELYKGQYGIYPNENIPVGTSMAYWGVNNDGAVYSNFDLAGMLVPYLPIMPRVPSNSYTAAATAYAYYNNTGTGARYKCAEDDTYPPYVIGVNSANTELYNAFEDKGRIYTANSPYTSWSLAAFNYKCISL